MATNAPSRVKKLINDVEDLVPESLAGLAGGAPGHRQDRPGQNLVLRAGGPKRGKVALVSGGGSGHEPLHGGFVGLGMLDAAAAGHVFTSPVPDQMEAATRAVDGGAGVLHIVKNYTGDVLNFQLAAELVGRRGRGRDGRHQRRRRGPGLAVHGRPTRRRRAPSSSRRSPAPMPRPAARWPT